MRLTNIIIILGNMLVRRYRTGPNEWEYQQSVWKSCKSWHCHPKAEKFMKHSTTSPTITAEHTRVFMITYNRTMTAYLLMAEKIPNKKTSTPHKITITGIDSNWVDVITHGTAVKRMHPRTKNAHTVNATRFLSILDFFIT